MVQYADRLSVAYFQRLGQGRYPCLNGPIKGMAASVMIFLPLHARSAEMNRRPWPYATNPSSPFLEPFQSSREPRDRLLLTET